MDGVRSTQRSWGEFSTFWYSFGIQPSAGWFLFPLIAFRFSAKPTFYSLRIFNLNSSSSRSDMWCEFSLILWAVYIEFFALVVILLKCVTWNVTCPHLLYVCSFPYYWVCVGLISVCWEPTGWILVNNNTEYIWCVFLKKVNAISQPKYTTFRQHLSIKNVNVKNVGTHYVSFEMIISSLMFCLSCLEKETVLISSSDEDSNDACIPSSEEHKVGRWEQ